MKHEVGEEDAKKENGQHCPVEVPFKISGKLNSCKYPIEDIKDYSRTRKNCYYTKQHHKARIRANTIALALGMTYDRKSSETHKSDAGDEWKYKEA